MDHPAKFSTPVIEAMIPVIRRHEPETILDPFAGTQRVHLLSDTAHTVGVELEPEWATMGRGDRIVGNALFLPFADNTFDCLATSCCYGSRMADHHNAQDDSKRNTYRHTLGRPLHSDNAGAMQWGLDYQAFHFEAWMEAVRVLVPEPLVVLNLSNHIRKGREMLVSEWHLTWWLSHGFKLIETIPVHTQRQRQGANRDARVDHEWVFVLKGTT